MDRQAKQAKLLCTVVLRDRHGRVVRDGKGRAVVATARAHTRPVAYARAKARAVRKAVQS